MDGMFFGPAAVCEERSATPTHSRTRFLPVRQLCPAPAAGSPFSLLLLVTLGAVLL